MPTIRFQVVTDLPPDRVLGALIDFSDQRPIVWPKIDHGHFRVHGQGADWADVTEGNALAWERNRYEWNAAAGEVTVTCSADSNVIPVASALPNLTVVFPSMKPVPVIVTLVPPDSLPWMGETEVTVGGMPAVRIADGSTFSESGFA